MPVYFGPVAPACPLSHDEPVVNPGQSIPIIRTAVPPAVNLPTALAAANFARDIVQSIINNRIINNVFNQPRLGSTGGKTTVGKDQNRLTHAHWAELTQMRVKSLYKYYGKTPDDKPDKDNWVVMERIEQMAWYDPAWNTMLVWRYGNKGEGEPVTSIFE